MGMLYQHSNEVDKVILQLDVYKRNRSEIYRYITLNCSQLLIEYPEFMIFSQVDLCQSYYFALTLGKMMLLSSILYYIYLLYFLYNPSVLLLISTGISSAFPFLSSFINNVFIFPLFESTVILTGYIVIVVHSLLPNFNDRMTKTCSSKDKTEHIVDANGDGK